MRTAGSPDGFTFADKLPGTSIIVLFESLFSHYKGTIDQIKIKADSVYQYKEKENKTALFTF